MPRLDQNDSFKDYVLDQMSKLEGISARRMFGGYGLYRNAVFFGIIHKGRLYFKTDATTQPEYQKAGMKPFRPNTRQTLKTYYEVPPDILEEPALLLEWARKAARSQKAPPKR